MLIKMFNAELVQVLEKRSLNDLGDFIRKWEIKGVYDHGTFSRYTQATEIVKMQTLCNMITNVEGVSKETKDWAKEWLSNNKASTQIHYRSGC